MLVDPIASELALDLSEQPPWPLFHYSDSVALCGILKDRELWATHPLYLNDATELTLGEQIAQDVFNEFSGAAKPGDERFALDSLAKSYAKRRASTRHDLFVVSLSEDGDMLSQWRGYAGNGGGFSIGFGGLPILPRHWPHTMRNDLGTQIIRCVYDQAEFREKLTSEIETVILNARQLAANDQMFDWMLHVPNALLHVAHTRVPALKHSGFREEAEWRLVATIDPKRRDVEFRPTSQGLVPYVRVPAAKPDEPIDISAVIVGPTQLDVGVLSARVLMEQRGYSPDLVARSEVPYRQRRI